MLSFLLLVILGASFVDGQSDGIRVSAHEWYPDFFPLEFSEQIRHSNNIRCNLVASAVKAALTMKKLTGFLTKSELIEAIGHFESCREELCQNNAMLDQFMKPETFQEQINILLVKAKIPYVPKEEKKYFLRGLINAKYWNAIYDGPFPDYSQDSKHIHQNTVRDIIETTCGYQSDGFADHVRPNDVTTIFLFILVDRYTENAIDEIDVKDIAQAGIDLEKNEAWDRIAERIFHENAIFASTCLDPAIAYYDTERHSVKRIREFAQAMGIICDKPEPIKIQQSEAAAPIFNDYAMASAPGSPGGSSSGGAPGSPGSSFFNGGAPGSPGSTRGGGFRP